MSARCYGTVRNMGRVGRCDCLCVHTWLHGLDGRESLDYPVDTPLQLPMGNLRLQRSSHSTLGNSMADALGHTASVVLRLWAIWLPTIFWTLVLERNSRILRVIQ